MPEPVDIVEIRVLDGPNLYFPKPAVKLTLAVPGWIHAAVPRLERLASRIDLSGNARPGARATEQRRRFTARAGAHVARTIARSSRVRLGVRGRPAGHDRVVVAFPWRRRDAADALARQVAAVMRDLLATRRSLASLVAEAAERITGVDPGPAPTVVEPTIPVIAVTGTNGKTTTVRLLSHIARTAGRSVAYSSTDGVFHDGALVEAGDYSGFGGAQMALAQPGIDMAILETARGGILLRGIGTSHNDVSVVTNISADHLGLHGIDTLDELAEVKATITTITKPDGWHVLNADDPRVLAMDRRAGGRPFLVSLDPRHPALRGALADGGRALTVLDHGIAELGRSGSRRIVDLEQVPMTLAGIASQHVHNALSASAAALAVGLQRTHVVQGLRSFLPDADANPGRANVYTLGERVLVVDYAHNEAGMAGLTEIARGLCPRDAETWVGFGTAGDRDDAILHRLGYRAGRGADHVCVAELPRYLRGRDPEDLIARLLAGAIEGGAGDVPAMPDEIAALRFMLDRSGPRDVLAITVLAQRQEMFALLEGEMGARRADPATVRRLVRRARPGRH
ncbi:MAG TPA: Mur ligase family protein [Actinomycetota bacterium]|nr:Mur ligase family protein [Actinomycetota bacterium]